ncbi:NAD(P)/FAD-dependent oxidoreductase [Actinocorallia longicatena]|uniref:NAD(P)/FAD-dependent oxidoreductase n=1 Tax=Actinocorallia longicatena TaxID=111803 RepID=A0ABP6QI85_9ACTN
MSHKVVIVGTGFSGLGMAIALKRAGEHDFVVLEKAGEVGGTWRENTYPGAACDIMSLLYSYSFEPRTTWSRMYPRQEELLDYIRHCVSKYGIADHIRYDTEVLGAEYDDAGQVWHVTTNGPTYTGRALVTGMGPLHQPNIPDLPGLETFEGVTFHSAQWRHDHDLRGKRVAVIGTGASAIQFVPQIAGKAGHLTVFQRTPAWILPKPDRPVAGFERRLWERVPAAQKLYRAGIYLAQESAVLGFKNPRVMRAGEALARRHLRRQIPDPAMRARLTPKYTMGCKRTLVSSDYYPALVRPNVTVDFSGIKEIRENAVVSHDGTVHEVDTIIFGTGFHVVDAMENARLTGADGVKIQDAWRDGVEAHMGVAVKGFPNLFLILGPNSGLGHNSMIFMIEAQVRYVLQALKLLDGRTRVAVRPGAQDRFNAWVQRRSAGAVWVSGGCTSWYLDASGTNRAAWPASTLNYWIRTRRIRKADFELT